ncbi:DUF1778 domain-containing protein [Acidithiobacillus thiooxidans]|jgi:uncharacterized protein (DUF1778 family)|uniref:DUF1778 domain-containing protein n=1 Tax=Acidithiobacillus thiooxidans TaxID=930 RepID=A0A1C2J0I6_ACITH|nr:DUF1778 domain-containing protein [Acidithiobacillus thiooxidans]MBU2835284.1 DUF1778 domain-containing protein [Acidithiobacillus thiooxidans]OCX71414.1 hypothetical protein A6M23_11855 [Acidithiobacillus thiooxidans]OCX81783.1 hypothetical protein A6P08_13280 [Acidithiobacillus thiooxidans]
MEAKTTRNERIDLRVTGEFKNRVAEAAAVYGVSVSTFISMSAMERAHRVLAEQKSVVLTDSMREQFMEALRRPVRPIPESIHSAANNYARVVRRHVD